MEDSDKAVFTSRQILENLSDVLLVIHDYDDDWQFLTGFEENERDGRIVWFNEMFQIDRTLVQLQDLPIGVGAIRQSAATEWEFYKLEGGVSNEDN